MMMMLGGYEWELVEWNICKKKCRFSTFKWNSRGAARNNKYFPFLPAFLSSIRSINTITCTHDESMSFTYSCWCYLTVHRRQPADDDVKSAIWFSDTWRADVQWGTEAAAEWDDVNFYWIMKNHLYETMETQRFFYTEYLNSLTHSNCCRCCSRARSMCFTLIDLLCS